MSCPLALFAFRRPDHLKQVVSSLLANKEVSNTDLFIFCDGAKSPEDIDAVKAVRSYAKTVSGFRKVEVIEREENFGLSRSITEGVSTLCGEYGRVAVVEDDVLVSPFFLSWINSALDKYEDDERVLSVGSYVFPTQKKLPESFFLSIPDCWGWAVWSRSWRLFQSDGLVLLRALENRSLEHRFDFEGAYPYTEMLRAQTVGKNDSWAIRWSASVLLAGGLTLYPGQSMTRNIGFDGTGTHCGVGDKYESKLASKQPVLKDIPVVESEEARSVWRDFFLQLQSSGAVRWSLNSIRTMLKRRLAWLR